MTLCRAMFAAVIAAAAVCRAAPPATGPAGTPAADDVDVTEWVVFVANAQRPRANARGDWPNTLPPFVTSRRATADAASVGRATPIGLIRVRGRVRADAPLDVLLTPDGGEFHATWPKAQVRSGRVLWSALVTDDAARPGEIDPTHWLTPLRATDSATLRAGTQAERFLLYDVSVNFKPPLQVSADGDALSVAPTGDAPLHDVTLYKKSPSGWTRGSVGTLVPARVRTPPVATAPASTTATADPSAAFDFPATRPAGLATTTPAATQPASQAAGPGTTVRLAPVPAEQDPLAPWQAMLATAGVLPGDVETVLAVLRERGLSDAWLTVVYRMDAADLDRVLPIEVLPTPHKLTRVGLVVIRGLDPAIHSEIDRLIAQCGDADYARRKSATAALIALGQPAEGKLRTAVNSPDIEIAERAETVLAAIEKAKKP